MFLGYLETLLLFHTGITFIIENKGKNNKKRRAASVIVWSKMFSLFRFWSDSKRLLRQFLHMPETCLTQLLALFCLLQIHLCLASKEQLKSLLRALWQWIVLLSWSWQFKFKLHLAWTGFTDTVTLSLLFTRCTVEWKEMVVIVGQDSFWE